MSAQIHHCKWSHWRDVHSNDDDTLWSLSVCAECGLVRLETPPSQEIAYPSAYYGRGDRKFIPGLESLSRVKPTLMRGLIKRAEHVAGERGCKPRVLDIGCGRGYLLRELAARGWACAGIDIASAPIPSDASQAGLDCRVGDACELPWRDGAFDLVVMNHVLEHVSDPWQACRQAHRVLLYIGVPNYASLQSQVFQANWFPLEIPRHIYHFSRASLKHLLADTGFTARQWSTRSFRQGVFAFMQSVLNTADPTHRNQLLSIIKGEASIRNARNSVHLLIAGMVSPVGILQESVASLLGCGSVLATTCKKTVVRHADK
jgi:SAM-dependent methyltransferase